MALGDSDIIEKSPETYTMGKEKYPHWIEIFDVHDKIQKRVFLYEVEISNGVEWPSSPVVDPKNPSIKLYDPNLRENERLEYQYVWGQVFYWSVPNNGNFKITKDTVNSLDISQPSNFNAMYTIAYNRKNSVGESYIKSRRKSYPIKYPNNNVVWSTYLGGYQSNVANFEIADKSKSNWNYKLLPDSTSIGAIPWLSYSSTLKGLPRYVYAANPIEEYGGTLLYPFDIGDKETELIINPATIVYHPWENGSSIKMDNGQVNKDFDEYGIRDDMIMTYQTFRTFYPSIERLINAKKNDPKYKKYEDPDDPLKKETAIFLDYIVCRTYAGIDSYGWFELKIDLDPNGSHLYRYRTARTPKLIQNKDFIFGTKEKPIVEKNIKYSMTAWDRDPDGDGVFEARNTVKMVEGVDKLKPNHKYSLHAYGKFIGRDGLKTYHYPIVANVYAAYNEFAEGGKYAGQRNYWKLMISDVPAYDAETGEELKGPVNVNTQLLDFKVLDGFSFPKEFINPITGQKELVEKVSIYFINPYQAKDPHTGESHPYYHVKSDLEKDDNFIAPDFCVLTFDVEGPVRDLKIASFRLYDPEQARFLAEGETLERDKTYKSVITVKNLSDYHTTSKNIEIHFFDGIKGEQYTNDNVSPNLRSITSVNSQIPKSSAGVVNPIPPEGTVQFVADVVVPKDGYVPSTVKFTALIPSLYDGIDNIRVDKDDKVNLTFRVGSPANENLKIVDIELYDATSGTLYNTQNLDGTYKFSPNRTYTAIVKMAKEGKKALGSATDTKHPRVLLKLIEYSGTGGSTKIISEYYLRAKSNGYYKATTNTETITLEFDLKNFPINGNRVTLVACVPEEYSNFNGINYNEITGNEDQMEKTWSADLDFAVSNFILYPAVVTASNCVTSQSQSISFSATLSMINNTADVYVDRVSLVIKDRYGSIVYRDDNVVFSSGAYSKVYSGTFPNPYTLRIDNSSSSSVRQGNNPFTIEINTTPVRYQETNWSNNSATNEVVLKSYCTTPQTPMPCMMPNTRTEWGPVTFQYEQGKGELVKYTYKRLVYSGIWPNITYEEREVTSYYCYPFDEKNWETKASFWETLNITGIWFRSQDTVDKGYNGYINIKGDNKNATVRAGQWFEVYVETRYDTNRSEIPEPGPRRSDMCNYINRTPGYNVVNPAPSYIWWKMEGYGVDEFMPFNYGSGGYVKRYYLPQKIDKFGQTSSRRFIPENGKDGVINITVATDDQFYGYTLDYPLHPYKVLCDRATAKIYIVGGSNVKSQITEE